MGNSASSSKKGCFGVRQRIYELKHRPQGIDDEADYTASSSNKSLSETRQQVDEVKHQPQWIDGEADCTASSSTKSLSEIGQQVIELRRLVRENNLRECNVDPSDLSDELPNGFRISTSFCRAESSHLVAVLDYILKLECISSSNISAGIPDVVRNRMNELYNYDNLDEMVDTFARDIPELFSISTQPKLPDKAKSLKKNELMAAFIGFLLQLLLHIQRTDSIKSLENQVDTLKKELRFLATILGDATFLGAELEQVHNLLAEFEAVVNDAGSLVYSFIFNRRLGTTTEKDKAAIYALLERLGLLKANIIEFSEHITRAGMFPETASVDSLFIVDSLLCDIEDLMSREDGLIVAVKDQIKILREELMLCDSLFNVAEVSQYSEIQEFKKHATRIRYVAYEAEYLINSFLVGDAPLWYCSIRLPHVTHKFKLIGTGLQKIKKDYGIGTLDVANNFSGEISVQAMRNISEVDDIIVGFEEKATDILDQLVGGTEKLQIISIIGMPGLGKTTFAKKLYNHPLVTYRFDKCSWCVVSQTYHRRSLLNDILISFTSELDKVRILNMGEENLVQYIYKSLKGRRYLLVIDDIWSSDVWNDLRIYFPDDGNGSRILFTSRNKDVAPPNSIIYVLPFLSNDQCWELLEKKVFQNKPCPPKLLRVGKRIAENCYGLPLVVVVVAGTLSTMDSEESIWENVGGSVASYIFAGTNSSALQILELSYNHLPNHLKPCFLYFGAFPEDSKIRARKLIKLWIAEGFIRKEHGKTSESIAEEYLMELIDKSLVMIAERRSDGGVKACVIHDLLRDLCLRKADEENFLKSIDSTNSIYEKHQRLRVYVTKATCQFLGSSGLHVRSFFGSHCHSRLDIFNMKLLRVLDLRSTSLSDLDFEAIKHLVRLKYLAIDHNIQIQMSVLSCLVNLEFLLVVMMEIDIFSLTLKLLKLRYLQVRDLVSSNYITSQTNNLEFLSKVTINRLKDEEILKSSPNLRKLKCICKPLLVEQGKYRFPDLCFFTHLESLNMKFHRGERVDVSFPPSIKKLTLSGLWFTSDKMSVIGRLPNLQVLKLEANAVVGETWETRDDEFQQLTFLKLEWLGINKWNVEPWHFPKLQTLVFRVCILEIPCEIGEIPTLQSIEIHSCPKHVVESAAKIEQEQRDMGNEELRVVIR